MNSSRIARHRSLPCLRTSLVIFTLQARSPNSRKHLLASGHPSLFYILPSHPFVSMSLLTVAAATLHSLPLDFKNNRDAILEGIREARRQGARVIVTVGTVMGIAKIVFHSVMMASWSTCLRTHSGSWPAAGPCTCSKICEDLNKCLPEFCLSTCLNLENAFLLISVNPLKQNCNQAVARK